MTINHGGANIRSIVNFVFVYISRNFFKVYKSTSIVDVTQRNEDMTHSQCNGTTIKGQRCKIKISNGEKYCHYHQKQDNHNFKRDTYQSTNLSLQHARTKDYQRGYIYVYTLQHLLSKSPKKQDWLQVKKLAKAENVSKWKVFDPKKHILLKIGLTTGTVTQRLKQWEAKCNHSVVYVDPYVDYSSSLGALFSKLKISKNHHELKHYDVLNHGFFTPIHLAKIEKSIHKSLWELYGRGDIICHGCSNDTKEHGIHVEWFMVRRKDLKVVFKLIDEICDSFIKT